VRVPAVGARVSSESNLSLCAWASFSSGSPGVAGSQVSIFSDIKFFVVE